MSVIDPLCNLWRVHFASFVPAPLWWESEHRQRKWIEIVDSIVSKGQLDPQVLSVASEVLYQDGTMLSAASLPLSDSCDGKDGVFLRPGDMFASDPVHWVMYIGEGVYVCGSLQQRPIRILGCTSAGIQSESMPFQVLYAHFTIAGNSNFVHMNNRSPRWLALLDYVVNGATPAWVMVQSIHEKKRAPVFRRIPGIKACPTPRERLDRLIRARECLGPVSWHLRYCNCQHVATYMGTGTFPTETPQSAAAPWMFKALGGLALVSVLRRHPYAVRSLFWYSVKHDHRTQPAAVRERAGEARAVTLPQAVATGIGAPQQLRSSRSTSALSRLRGAGRNLFDGVQEWSGRLGPFAGLSAALTTVLRPQEDGGAQGVSMEQEVLAFDKADPRGQGTRAGTSEGIGGGMDAVREACRRARDAATREVRGVCDPLSGRARGAMTAMRGAGSMDSEPPCAPGQQSTISRGLDRAADAARDRIAVGRRAAAQMLGLAERQGEVSSVQSGILSASLSRLYDGLQGVALWALRASTQGATDRPRGSRGTS